MTAQKTCLLVDAAGFFSEVITPLYDVQMPFVSTLASQGS